MGAREGLGASVLAGFYRNVAAAEPAGDGEEGFPPSLAGRGAH